MWGYPTPQIWLSRVSQAASRLILCGCLTAVLYLPYLALDNQKLSVTKKVLFFWGCFPCLLILLGLVFVFVVLFLVVVLSCVAFLLLVFGWFVLGCSFLVVRLFLRVVACGLGLVGFASVVLLLWLVVWLWLFLLLLVLLRCLFLLLGVCFLGLLSCGRGLLSLVVVLWVALYRLPVVGLLTSYLLASFFWGFIPLFFV